MTQGSVTRLVNTFGSKWGKVRPNDDPRDIFFNIYSLAEGVDFAAITVGREVQFEEVADHVSGSHAEQLMLLPVAEASNVT